MRGCGSCGASLVGWGAAPRCTAHVRPGCPAQHFPLSCTLPPPLRPLQSMSVCGRMSRSTPRCAPPSRPLWAGWRSGARASCGTTWRPPPASTPWACWRVRAGAGWGRVGAGAEGGRAGACKAGHWRSGCSVWSLRMHTVCFPAGQSSPCPAASPPHPTASKPPPPPPTAHRVGRRRRPALRLRRERGRGAAWGRRERAGAAGPCALCRDAAGGGSVVGRCCSCSPLLVVLMLVPRGVAAPPAVSAPTSGQSSSLFLPLSNRRCPRHPAPTS